MMSEQANGARRHRQVQAVAVGHCGGEAEGAVAGERRPHQVRRRWTARA